jgi:hypothetical protein
MFILNYNLLTVMASCPPLSDVATSGIRCAPETAFANRFSAAASVTA